MMDAKALLDRFQRASGGVPVALVLKRYRAIVGPQYARVPAVQDALEALRNGQVPTPTQLAALEEAIRTLRPALLFEAGQLADLSDDGRGAFPGWGALRAAVARHVYAIGRIDGPMGPTGDVPSFGTGFLVAEDVLITNRHVLWALASGTDALEKGQAYICFGQEASTFETEGPVPIVGVIATHPSADITLLRLVKPAARVGRAPLAIDDRALGVGTAVAAVGYPFPDGERNPAFVSAAFGSKFGVKRGSPGEVIGGEGGSIYHDCSTLGGNSGSPLLALDTASVVAVHCRGGFATRNEAVSGAVLAGFVKQTLAA